jgi:hypothetical protein
MSDEVRDCEEWPYDEWPDDWPLELIEMVDCRDEVITRLRARIAELQNASHDAGIAELVNEESLKARIAELEAPVPKTFQHAIRRVVITEDNEVIYDAEDDDVGCVYIVTPEVMRNEIRPILDGWVAGRFVTEEQIDAAWGHVRWFRDHCRITVADNIQNAIEELGIEECPGCGGSGDKIDRSEEPGFVEDDCPACHRNGKSHGWVWRGDSSQG